MAQIQKSIADLKNFDRYGEEGQILVQAVCTALNGGGWSFAVVRSVSTRILG